MKFIRKQTLISTLITILMIFSVCAASLFDSLKTDAEDVSGKRFDSSSAFIVAKPFEKAPATLEATVSVSAGFQGRGGVILGNYTGSSRCLNFEIYNGGNPRIFYIDDEGVGHNLVFTKVDVRGGEPVHVAIVCDAESGKYLCYKNGVLEDSIDGAAGFSILAFGNALMAGGDRRANNTEFFKGTIQDIVCYESARSAEEIAADAAGRSGFGDAMMALDFRDGGDKLRFEDLSGNGFDAEAVVKWLDHSPPLLDYEFSICLVGDTQKISMRNPRHVSYIYDWICDNIESKKIAFVMHMGDITENSWDSEWAVQSEEIFKLNGKVGYSMIRGNHDTVEGFNKTFSVPGYMGMLLGTFDGTPLNSYQTFNAGGQDFLHVCLDYGASDAALNWAAGIIEAHPEHLVIITTHCYLYHDGTTLDINDPVPPNYKGTNDGWANNGDQMWDKLMSKYPNIYMVCCGHDPWDEVVVAKQRGDNGNIVTAMLANPQGIDLVEGSSGIVTMLYFSRDGKRMQIENYSTIRQKYYVGSPQQTVEMPGFPSYPPKHLNVDVKLGEHLKVLSGQADAAAPANEHGDAAVPANEHGDAAVPVNEQSGEASSVNEQNGAAPANTFEITESSGGFTLKVPFGEPVNIVLVPEEGYCIPENFTCEACEGVTVTRESFDRLVISGTPVWHASLKLGDAEAHVPSDVIRENETLQDCLNNGSYEEAVYCSKCGTELSREFFEIPANGHVFGGYAVTTQPTCTGEGEERRYCHVCGEYESRVIPAAGHKLQTHQGIDPTEEEPGCEPYETCETCDYTTYKELPRLAKSGPDDTDAPTVNVSTVEPHQITPTVPDNHVVRFVDAVFAADKLCPSTGIREVADEEEPGDDTAGRDDKENKAK